MASVWKSRDAYQMLHEGIYKHFFLNTTYKMRQRGNSMKQTKNYIKQRRMFVLLAGYKQ